jgi:hypothetical protein
VFSYLSDPWEPHSSNCIESSTVVSCWQRRRHSIAHLSTDHSRIGVPGTKV